jgi:2-polyprenyl-3-methyl-5-hydroxy-6-metoxy-1,4-benzoquinol methylase
MEDWAVEWSKIFWYRDKIHKRYPDIWGIPLIKKRSQLLKGLLKDHMSLLDVGAGMKGMEQEIENLGLKLSYKSMDVDTTYRHDYYSLDAIEEQFDVILLFEVIEHLTLQEGLNLLQKLHGATKDNGLIVVSTPNIFNPSRYMRDATHRTFYAYDELCGLLNMAGFSIKDLYRSYNDAFHRYILKVYLLGFLFRVLSIDYAYSVFAVGEKG